ncbi:MAG TPA: LysM peptidoglycan-binding domain-containing protein [Anaerolineaceae bacterium]|nr:LysM peptidoglycan-binding domain-containing protein [Anaerolineaceae bacterium]HPN52673.1 LysM peptidoglycan-binding domain-containing protein [Anaerolineaceae bacterium]
MSGKDSDTVYSYRKRNQLGPIFIVGAAVILIVLGIIIIVSWLGNAAPPPTPTPTATNIPPTATHTNTPLPPTATPTLTPTETQTPTITMSPTANAPFEYIVQDGDNCTDIAKKHNVDLGVLLAINNLDGSCLIQANQKIIIPAPNTQLPTETPLPPNLPKGTVIEYTVKSGDVLGLIAEKFNTTVAAIVNLNKLANENAIAAGDVLKIPVNMITAVPTRTLTRTMAGGNAPTATPEPPTATPQP